MRKWVIPLVCIALLTSGGCSGRKNSRGPAEDPEKRQGTREITFKRFDKASVPAAIDEAIAENRSGENCLLVEDNGRYWVILTRGLKPTGGYSVGVTKVIFKPADGGSGTLHVNYRYTDPGPGQFVTQVLTYPVDAVQLSGLNVKPLKTEFVRQK